MSKSIFQYKKSNFGTLIVSTYVVFLSVFSGIICMGHVVIWHGGLKIGDLVWKCLQRKNTPTGNKTRKRELFEK